MTPVIDVRDLTKRYGAITAVDHIGFRVEEGEIFGFLGPNGAGKTTTVRMLTGVIPMDSGNVTVLGHDIRSEPVLAKQQIGVVPETSNAYTDLTAWQNLMLMGELYGLPHARATGRSTDLLDTLGLLGRRDQKVQAYSKGMKQRLILAMALLHEPRLLFLDEPTSGVDPITRRHFWDFIKYLTGEGVTVFVTTHYMDEARNCDRVVMINEGKIAASGTPSEIIQKVFPDRPEAHLNEAFIRLMSRGSQ